MLWGACLNKDRWRNPAKKWQRPNRCLCHNANHKMLTTFSDTSGKRIDGSKLKSACSQKSFVLEDSQNDFQAHGGISKYEVAMTDYITGASSSSMSRQWIWALLLARPIWDHHGHPETIISHNLIEWTVNQSKRRNVYMSRRSVDDERYPPSRGHENRKRE